MKHKTYKIDYCVIAFFDPKDHTSLIWSSMVAIGSSMEANGSSVIANGTSVVANATYLTASVDSTSFMWELTLSEIQVKGRAISFQL